MEGHDPVDAFMPVRAACENAASPAELQQALHNLATAAGQALQQTLKVCPSLHCP